MRGYRSKKASLDKLLQSTSPTVCSYNETLLSGRNKVHHDYYKSFSKNRTDKKGGGISISVRQELKEHLVLAGEGQRDEEYQIVKLDCYSPPLNIVNSYGEQEKVGK